MDIVEAVLPADLAPLRAHGTESPRREGHESDGTVWQLAQLCNDQMMAKLVTMLHVARVVSAPRAKTAGS